MPPANNNNALTRRLAAGGLYSQASNFLAHVSTGVDPRTGQFTLSAKLPGLQANNLAGPVVSLSLRFSPLASHSDAGFGYGWQLGVSMLDLNTNRLSLVTGEQFRLDRHKSDFSDNGLLAFHDQKLRSFVVRQIGIDGRMFRVEHKSGDTEWLEVQERSGLALVVQMRSPQGRQAFFKWQTHGDGQFDLESIWDERGPALPLLKVVTNREGVIFSAFPGTDSESAITLQRVNGQLTYLILPDGDSRWTFEYLSDPDSGLLFPNRVRGPLGSEDTMTYATGDQGHRLPPGAPLQWLPRINSHRHAPGAGQPEIYREYTYVGTSNFLGGDVAPPGGWQDGTDNLYRMTNYHYTSIETVMNAKGEILATAERTWNRFHLQITEVMTRYSSLLQNGQLITQQKTITHKTVYGDDPHKSWEEQPAWFQLPVAASKIYTDVVQLPREIREETDYDDYGNILQKRYSDGRVETSNYYPLNGGDGCPDDGGLFVRWIKSKTLTPATPAAGALPIKTTYQYSLLPRRNPDDVQSLVAHLETAVALALPQEQLIGITEQIWDPDIDSAFFGQPVQTVNTYNGFVTTTTFKRMLDAEGVGEIQTRTGHDGLAVNTYTLRNSLTGLTLAEVNENGVKTTFAYDLLGRVVMRTSSAGSPYEVTNKCSYSTADSNHKGTVFVEESDITRQKLRRYLDGSGRTVREERQDIDITGEAFCEVWSCTYDHDGNVCTETAQDWLPGRDNPIRLTTTNESDSWGQVAVQRQPDGTSHHANFDPISLNSRHWQQDRNGKRSGETEVIRNLAGKVEKVTLREPSADNGEPGAVLRTESWTFDGLYRPIGHKVEADGLTTLTRIERDVLGRTTAFIREDSTIVRWTYAAHSEGEHPVKVTLTSPDGLEQVLAEQTFDSLGRPVSRRSGDQTETLHYLEGQLPPASATQSDGRLVRLSYERFLDNALISAVPEGDRGVSYQFRPPEGFLTQVTGGLGVIKHEYSEAGRLIKEDWTVANETHTNSSRQSLLGRALGFTDVGGTEHLIEYDDFGRPTVQKSGSVIVTSDYDAAGRVYIITTLDTEKNKSLQQTLSYDAFGRELKRTWLSSGSGSDQATAQTLSYTGRDKVASRRWEMADVLRSDEHYTYDLRGRLLTTSASGPDAPLDKRTGKRIKQQMFTLNDLDGYQQLETTYADNTRNTMTFTYDDFAPDRPISIIHRGVQDIDIDLAWDVAGRLKTECHNGVLYRQLEWDSNGRVRKITENGVSSHYRYDPLGRLAEQEIEGANARRFYAGNRVVNERSANGALLTLVRSANALFAESRLSETIRSVLMTGTDGQGSVRLENDSENRLISYTAHGSDDGSAHSRIGYAGELRDLATSLYHPGSYRPYSPELMLFLAPDSRSPMDEGGLNRYAYCGADPINRIDPAGQSFWSWLGVIVATVTGGILMVASFGVFAPVGAAMIAAVAGVMTAASTGAVISAVVIGAVAVAKTMTFTVVVAVASASLGSISLLTGLAVPIMEETGNRQAAEILGWISLGTGLASSVTLLAPSAIKASNKVMNLVGKWARAANTSAAKDFSMSAGNVLYALPGQPPVVFYDDLYGQGILAYQTHGNPAGQLMDTSGVMRPASYVAMTDIAPRLTGLNRAPDEPILLLACFSGRSGAAQEVANALQRPVIGFPEANAVYTRNYSTMNELWRADDFYPNANLITQDASGTIAWIQRLFGVQNREVAPMRRYTPNL